MDLSRINNRGCDRVRFELALWHTGKAQTQQRVRRSQAEHLPPGASAENANDFLRYLASIAHLQDVHFLWRPFLRDPDDDMVLECAVASGSQYIITHNTKDFKRAPELKVNAITPAEFLTLLRSKS